MGEQQKNYITPAGFKTLQEEYNRLRHEERPPLVETIHWAASLGDRSENGDYIYGKKRLREIDKRLRFLSKQLNNAEIVDPTTVKSETVLFGATVRVLDEEDNERVYYIVGADESNPALGKISWRSPIALALFKKQAGDFVSYTTPGGERDLEILAVTYGPVPD